MATTTSARTVSQIRRPLALRGALLLAFGLCEGTLFLFMFHLPRVTRSVLVLLIAAFLVLDGAVVLVEAARVRERSVWLRLLALTDLAAAGLVVLLPAGRVLAIFAWWAIITGLLDAGESLLSGPPRVAVPALSLALGLFVLAGPVTDPSLLLLAVAFYGVLAGAGRLWAARSRRLS